MTCSGGCLHCPLVGWIGSKVDRHRANEVGEIMGPWTELPVTPKHQLLLRVRSLGNEEGSRWKNVAGWRRRRRN